MRDGEDVEEMQFVKVYRAPKAFKISSAVGFVVTALMMNFMPAFGCDFNSSGVSNRHDLVDVGNALINIGTTWSYVVWLTTFICFVAGIVFTWNAKPKIIPIASSAFLTFATIFSSTIIKISGKVENFNIVKNYTMNAGFYLVLVLNIVLTVLTVVMMIKTKKKVELKFESDK